MTVTVGQARDSGRAQPIFLLEITTGGSGPVLYFSDRNITVSGRLYEDYIDDLSGIGEELRRADSSGLNADAAVQFSNERWGSYDYLIRLDDDHPFTGAAVTVKEVYLDNGLPSAPETVFVGVLDQPEEITTTGFRCNVSSRTAAMDAGWKQDTIDLATFPSADPDAVGKVRNIVVGAVEDVPCNCTTGGGVSTIIEDITAGQTYLEISGGTNEAAFPAAPFTVLCDGEEIRVTAVGPAKVVTGTDGNPYTCILRHVSAAANKPVTGADWRTYWKEGGASAAAWAAGQTYISGKTWTITRGYNSTTAVEHGRGTAVAEKRTYIFEPSKRVVRRLGDVRVNGLRVTSGVTRNVDDSGRATLTFDGPPVLEKAVGLGLTDPTHSHATGRVTSPVIGISATDFTGSGWTSKTGSVNNIYDQSDITLFKLSGTGGDGSSEYQVGFPAWAGSDPVAVYLCITHSTLCSGGANSYRYARIGSAGGTALDTSGNKVTQKFNIGTSSPTSYPIYVRSDDGSYSHIVYEVWLEVVITDTAGSSTGVSLSGNSAADMIVGGAVTVDVEADADPDGTYGGAGTLIERPDHVFRLMLTGMFGFTAGEIDLTSFDAAGAEYAAAVTGGYKFGFVINDKVKPSELLARLAFECRSTIRYVRGKWYLDFLPDAAPVPVDTITAGELAGRNAEFRYSRSPRVEVANDLTAKYRRDWSGKTDWLGVAKTADASSIAAHGTYPKEVEFMAVRTPGMAEDVLGHILLESAWPRLTAAFAAFWERFGLMVGQTYQDGGAIYPGRKFWIEKMTRRDRFTVDVEAREWW